MADPATKASADDLSSLERIKTKSADLTQAAARLGVSYNYLRVRAQDGRIPTFTVGKQIRIWLADLA
jgi:excisionase family DNA binding protein